MPGLLIITGNGALADRVTQVLSAAFPEARFLKDSGDSRWVGLRRRIRRHGVVQAAGQVAFRMILARMSKAAKPRIDALWHAAPFARSTPAPAQIHHVASVNSDAARDVIRQLSPDVVIVFATRKLAAATIAACKAPILNLHPGITPDYRGVHTGYWALRRQDTERFGATVHLIDEGLDTGPILAQVQCRPEGNVAIYPNLLTLAGLPLLMDAVPRVQDGQIRARPAGPPAPLCLEPTIWSYLAGGLRRGCW